jgi:hypothetical protein
MPKRTFLKLGTSATIVSFARCSDYFGASEATIFSKRESFRSGLDMGSRLKRKMIDHVVIF